MGEAGVAERAAPDPLEHDHSREAIRRRLADGPRQSYVRDWVYGAIDGTVTTFAIVSGVAGAGLSDLVIVVLGIANVLADGFSMAASNYSGTKAETEEVERLREIERRHIRLDPLGEREEIRQIFEQKGFSGDDLERAVDVITADVERWIRTMLAEEYGVPVAPRSPLLSALSTFSAFLACGAVPLVPFLLGLERAFEVSIAMTGAVFFAIGSLRSRWSVIPWWRAGLETFAIGSGAAAIAYAVGRLLGG